MNDNKKNRRLKSGVFVMIMFHFFNAFKASYLESPLKGNRLGFCF